MTIQQALFGRDIWGRTVALIDDIYRQHRINRKPPVRVEGASFSARPELQERGKQVLVLFFTGKKKSCLIFSERAGPSESLALSCAGLHRVRFAH